MTHDEQMKRLNELGWTCKAMKMRPSYHYPEGYKWHGPNDIEINIDGQWSEPPPIPAELLALLKPDEPEQAHAPEPWLAARGSHSYPLEILSATRTIAQVQHGKSMAETDANATRIVQCVNDCANIPDPAAHMAEQDAKIERLEEALLELAKETVEVTVRCYADDADMDELEAVKTKARALIIAIESAKK